MSLPRPSDFDSGVQGVQHCIAVRVDEERREG